MIDRHIAKCCGNCGHFVPEFCSDFEPARFIEGTCSVSEDHIKFCFNEVCEDYEQSTEED